MGIPGKRVTLKMIAEKADCSVAVVSTVLNAAKGRTVVCQALRDKVRRIAKELDYAPNFASRCLKANRSRTLGIYDQPKQWHAYSNQYEMSILSGIERAVFERNYDLLLLNFRQNNLPEICESRLKDRRIDGLLLLQCGTRQEWMRNLLKISPNLAAVDFNEEFPGLNRIAFDNRQAVRLAVETLLESGHRRIAFVGTCIEKPEYDALVREEAFREIVRERNLKDTFLFHRNSCPNLIFERERYCQREGAEAIRYLSALPIKPDAVICYNALAGGTLYYEALRMGYRIPEDFSLIVIDKPAFEDLGGPQIAYVDHPLDEMGYAAASQLINRLESEKETEPFFQLFSPEFIAKETFLKRF